MPAAKRCQTFVAWDRYFTLAANQWVRDRRKVFVIVRPCNLVTGRVWIGYDRGTLLEANLQVWCQNVNIGGIYLHKHGSTWNTPNDYHPLEELRDLNLREPFFVEPGMEIWVTRDIRNIGAFTCNAWDYELMLTVEE